MKVVSFDGFMANTLGGWPVNADISIYAGKPFECACGRTHSFSGHSSEVLRELGGMRFVLRCPERKAITLVKVKGFFSVILESQFGALLDVEESGQNEKRNEEPLRHASVIKVQQTAVKENVIRQTELRNQSEEHLIQKKLDNAQKALYQAQQELKRLQGVEVELGEARKYIAQLLKPQLSSINENVKVDAPILGNGFPNMLIEDSDKPRVRQLIRDAKQLQQVGSSKLNKEQLLTWSKREDLFEAYFLADFLGVSHEPPDFSDLALTIKLAAWLRWAE